MSFQDHPSPLPSPDPSIDDDEIIDQRRMAQQDCFDDVIGIEQQYVEIGFQEGKLAAFQQIKSQGQSLGFEYGQELGEEIGFYLGFCQSFLFTLLDQTQSYSPLERTEYSINYEDPALTLEQVKQYNKDYFHPRLFEDTQAKSFLQQQLSYSELKYNTVLLEILNLLSLTQSIRFMPGETGDIHLISDIRTRSRALFARMGIASVFKDQSVIDF